MRLTWSLFFALSLYVRNKAEFYISWLYWKGSDALTFLIFRFLESVYTNNIWCIPAVNMNSEQFMMNCAVTWYWTRLCPAPLFSRYIFDQYKYANSMILGVKILTIQSFLIIDRNINNYRYFTHITCHNSLFHILTALTHLLTLNACHRFLYNNCIFVIKARSPCFCLSRLNSLILRMYIRYIDYIDKI